MVVAKQHGGCAVTVRDPKVAPPAIECRSAEAFGRCHEGARGCRVSLDAACGELDGGRTTGSSANEFRSASARPMSRAATAWSTVARSAGSHVTAAATGKGGSGARCAVC